ncbi:MAG: malate synthase G, partial [Pseudohongiella sp.]|nr:malate synthase G [Pseudohongiella sp.]
MNTPHTQTQYQQLGKLQVASVLYQFVEQELLPGSGVLAADFWAGLEQLVADFAAVNHELLQQRANLQQQIDQWHTQHARQELDAG